MYAREFQHRSPCTPAHDLSCEDLDRRDLLPVVAVWGGGRHLLQSIRYLAHIHVREEKVGMEVDSRHRDEPGDRERILAGSYASCRGGNVARILRYDHTNC